MRTSWSRIPRPCFPWARSPSCLGLTKCPPPPSLHKRRFSPYRSVLSTHPRALPITQSRRKRWLECPHIGLGSTTKVEWGFWDHFWVSHVCGFSGNAFWKVPTKRRRVWKTCNFESRRLDQRQTRKLTPPPLEAPFSFPEKLWRFSWRKSRKCRN